MSDLTPAEGQPFLDACDKYPYHELVAYACGSTIGDLRDLLERGAVAGETEPGLGYFTREYCRRDADFARQAFEELREMKGGGNAKPLWDWFNKRWPCDNPLSVGNLLAGQRVEELSLEATFRAPSVAILGALTETGWFQAADLEDPPEALSRLLSLAGYERREKSDARPAPRPTPEG